MHMDILVMNLGDLDEWYPSQSEGMIGTSIIHVDGNSMLRQQSCIFAEM